MSHKSNASQPSYRDEMLNIYGKQKWKDMDAFHSAVNDHFRKNLRTNSKRIPQFRRHHSTLQDATLVRYRCFLHNHMTTLHVPAVVRESGEEIPAIAYDPFGWPEINLWENGYARNLISQTICTALPVPGEERWVVGEEYGEKHEKPPKIRLAFWTKPPRVTTVVEVIGIYYKPRNEGSGFGTPCIYVLGWENGKLDHHLVPEVGGENFEQVVSKFKPAASKIREQILNYICQCIGGNKIVSEYFFMQLCSTINRRQEILSGKVSINLTGVPPSIGALFVSRLHACFATLVPRVISVNMHGHSFEQERWVPVKDFETDELSNSKLQCALQTHLIINATALQEGKYEDVASRNIKALNDIITSQVVFYDFRFSQHPFECDMPTVVVSEGKTFFHTDLIMSIGDISEDDLVQPPTASEEQLHEWRQYIACARKLSAVKSMKKCDDLTELLAQDVGKFRQHDAGKEIKKLHTRICLSQLLGLTHLERECGTKEYKLLVEMEKNRMQQYGTAGSFKQTAV